MMKTRRLGKNGPVVSAIGLGCMGMTWAYGARDDDETSATIARALDLGISLFDTADVYGPYTNEEFVGAILRKRRDEVFLATKFGLVPSAPGTNSGVNGRPKHVKASIDGSLKRLGFDHVDLYYLHRVDPDVPIEETVGAMGDLVNAGKVRFLGLSEAGPATLERAHRTHPITALQSEYSLWTRDPEDEDLAMCRKLGVGFVPFSPLGRGFLTGTVTEALPEGDTRHTHPRFAAENIRKNLALADRVKSLAATKGITAAQLALAWVLAKGDDIVPIPGTKKRRYLEENAASVDVVLTADDVAEIEAAVPKEAIAGDRYPQSAMKMVGL